MTYDTYFLNVAQHIVQHPEFLKLKTIPHHTTTRYNHVLLVAYMSYYISKHLKLDCEATIRGALLHDFFLESTAQCPLKEQWSAFRSHPKKAAARALLFFNINEKEIDIITKHMFPATLTMPRYAESWLVSAIDSVACMYELIAIRPKDNMVIKRM